MVLLARATYFKSMHVVVIALDGVQPAYLGPYGCEWLETPTWDRWAARGVVFDAHFAEAPNAPAPTWETGPLEAAGVAVGHGLRSAAKLAKSPNAVLFIDVPPLNAPTDGDFAERQDAYAAAIVKLDSRLEKLETDLAERGWGDAVIFVTACRGCPLGEHDVIGLPGPLHEEFIHLPLMMAWPDGQHSGRRTSALTQPMDLMPTLFELFGVDGDAVITGRSLLPLVRSPLAIVRPHALIADSAAIGVRTPDWYFLQSNDSARLFVKPDDRWEMHDVAGQHEDVVESLRALAVVNPAAK